MKTIQLQLSRNQFFVWKGLREKVNEGSLHEFAQVADTNKSFKFTSGLRDLCLRPVFQLSFHKY